MNAPLAKFNQGLAFFILLTVVLFYGKPILIPLFFAIMLAMLMAPVCRKLDKKGLPRALSCLVCVLILFLVFLSMLAIVGAQVSSFAGDISLLEQKTSGMLASFQKYVEQRFGIPMAEQTAFIERETKNLGRLIRTYLTGMLRTSVQTFAGLIITLVMTFLFLFQQEKYYSFFLKFVKGKSMEERRDVLNRISDVAQHYLVGRSISIITLFVLYAIALLIIGIKNALLLAAVAALFNIIPYLGPILAALIPVLVAFLTEDSYQPAIWVLISFCLFQALDNYFVTPYFLGGEVSLSALSTIVIMLCGGFLWGIAGMILFIPLLSIAKIIFDHVPGLQMYGQLIGDDSASKPSKSLGTWFRKLFKKA